MLQALKIFCILLARSISCFIFFAISTFFFLSLSSYSKFDQSFNVATSNEVKNLCMEFGSYTSDFFFTFLGASSFFIPLYLLFMSIKIFFSKSFKIKPVYFLLLIISCNLLISMIYSGDNYRIYGIFSMLYSNYISHIDAKYSAIIRAFLLAIFFFSFQEIFEINAIKKLFLKKFNLFLGKFENSNQINLTDNNIKFEFLDTTDVLFEKNQSSDNNLEFKKKLNEKIYTSVFIDNKIANNKLYKYSNYGFSNLLSDNKSNIKEDFIDLDFYEDQKNFLKKILKDFGINGEIVDYKIGPVIVLYEFEPAAGIKSSRVIGLSDDLARFMKVVSTRISTIIGKSALGIEVPKQKREFFCLKEIIEDRKFSEPKLPLALGKSICGDSIIADLYSMPHLLIAGTTGSGKSVSINAIIISLLLKHSPKTCRLIMIDPKMLELSVYNDIPHLITPVVTDPKKAIGVLQWLLKEMEERYRTISFLGVRNICKYNEKIREAIKNGIQLERSIQTGFDQNTGDPIFEKIKIEMKEMHFIVVVVDEMADLMLVSGKEVEITIQRLSQMARAAGIHLILSTQRPSVDVITGVIKANLPTRISFSVSSKIDSRTIIGEQGAEQLLRMGDMLYMYEGKISRIHGPFVDDNEVHSIVKYLKNLDKPNYIKSIDDFCEKIITKKDINLDEDCSEIDDEYSKALEILKNEEKISISYIQRKLRIGYNKAANIIERMEEEGIIGPPNRSGKREIICS